MKQIGDMNTNNPTHFRGVKKVYMVMVLEGNGADTNPWREVKYFYDLEQHGGTHGGLIGKIDPVEHPENQAASSKPL
jgi:hypothetical protein